MQGAIGNRRQRGKENHPFRSPIIPMWLSFLPNFFMRDSIHVSLWTDRLGSM